MTCNQALEVARSSVELRVAVLLKHADAARAQDIDGIHDLRVASRRLRASLREAAGALGPGPSERLAATVRKVTQGLGRAREIDVSIELLQQLRRSIRGDARYGATAALAVLRMQREAESARVVSAAAVAVSPEFRKAAAGLTKGGKEPSACLLVEGRQRVLRGLSRLRRAANRWRKSGCSEDLHQARVRLKKLRYTCEYYAPAFGKPLSPLIRRMKDFQEALGQWNDLRILSEHLASVRDDSRLALSSGSAGPGYAERRAAEGLPTLIALVDGAAASRLEAIAAAAAGLLDTRGKRLAFRGLAEPVLRCPDCPYRSAT